MAKIEFTGHDLVVWFQENPSNEQEWQYRIRYECANETVTHFVKHNEHQSGEEPNRLYKDVLTFEENRAAGLTRSPKIYIATQAADGAWTDDAMDLEIEAYNPPPGPARMFYEKGVDGVRFDFDKPLDPDFAGIALWADTQTPVRKDQTTSKYIGPNLQFTLALAEDTTYYVTYAAYDSFGFELLNETTERLSTLPRESWMLPILQEALEPVQVLQFENSTALAKLQKAYDVRQFKAVNKAEERLGQRIDDQGRLVSEKILELGSTVGDVQANLELIQETISGPNEAVAQQLLALGARVGANEASLIDEKTVRADRDEAIAQSVTQLNVKVTTDTETLQAAIREEQTTRATKDEALAEQIRLLGAKLEDAGGSVVEAAIVEERRARVTADEALTQRLDQQASKIGANEAQFSSDIRTLVNKDQALTTRIDQQAAQWNSDINGAVTAATRTINQNIANGDAALSQRITNLSAQIGQDGWSAALQQEQTARANADAALGQRIDRISVTDYSGKIATIEQNMSVQGDRINGLRAQYTLRIDNNGVVSGFGLGSDPNGNSEFAISADRFLISHTRGRTTPFRIVGGQVFMTDAIVNNLTVKDGNFETLTVHGDKILPFTLTQSMRYMWDGHNSDNIPSESSGLSMSSLCMNTQYQWVDLAPSGPVQGTLNYVADGSRVLLTFSICSRQTGGNDDAYKFRIRRNDGHILPTTPWMCYTTGKAISQAWTFIDDNLGGGSSASWRARTYTVQALRPGSQQGRLLACSLVGFVANK